jgi:hypothetical protein
LEKEIFSCWPVLLVSLAMMYSLVSISSCFGLGFDPFGGAFAKALIMLPEIVRFIPVPDAFAVSGALQISYMRLDVTMVHLLRRVWLLVVVRVSSM